jgi:hypothetical protein
LPLTDWFSAIGDFVSDLGSDIDRILRVLYDRGRIMGNRAVGRAEIVGSGFGDRIRDLVLCEEVPFMVFVSAAKFVGWLVRFGALPVVEAAMAGCLDGRALHALLEIDSLHVLRIH